MLGTKLLIFPVKIWIFCPKRPTLAQIGIFVHFGPGLAGLFDALLVVGFGARPYLARHLFTSFMNQSEILHTI